MKTVVIRVYRSTFDTILRGKGFKNNWRWSMRHGNGRRIIGASTEGYCNRKDALRNIYAVTGIRLFEFEFKHGGNRFEFRVTLDSIDRACSIAQL